MNMKWPGLLALTLLQSMQLMAADSPAAQTKPKSAAANASAAKVTASATDQLTLDATTVTGNKELPKVMYIVPWKRAELGQLPGQPFNSLVNDVLQPVDREVFRREVTYYEVVSGKDQPQAGAVKQTTSVTDGH